MNMPVGAFVARRPSKGKNRPSAPQAVVPKQRLAKSARAARGSSAPRRLGERLHRVKDAAQCLPSQGRDYAYATASVGPELKLWAVPQEGEAQLSRMGLSIPLNSQNRSRPGLSGISTYGKKTIQRSCALLDDFRSRTAMWTVTLEDEDYIALSVSRKWPDFQRRITDLLVRYLQANGDAGLVIAAVEIGAKRFARTGRPDPHIHIVTTGWKTKDVNGQYLLRPVVMDELVAKACQYAGLESRERPACSNISGIRHAVGAYMSKYLSKQMPVTPEALKGQWENLIPRQWFNQSKACKAMVDGATIKLPPAFSAFVVRQQKLLEQFGCGKGGVRTVGYKKRKIEDVPIEVFCFKFVSPEKLHEAMELFALWVENSETLNWRGEVLSG